MKLQALCILLIMNPLLLMAQQGIPYVNNYTKNDYDAAGRNWAITTDSKGNIYAGNSNGLLRFNGSNWELYPIPGNNMVRSVFCDKNDRIYIGSFEEFGFFENDEYGDLIYTSLADSLVHYEFHNDEVWNIVQHKEKIYFRSFTTYFTFNGKQVEALNLPFTLIYLTTINGNLYGCLLDKGFYLFNGDKFELLLSTEQLYYSEITAAFPYKEQEILLFSTNNGIFLYNKKGCYPWKNEANEILKSAVINRVAMTKDSSYIIGTISNGIYALDKHGKLLWSINTETGLANNTVLSVCCDNDNNIWAALDNGISYIRSNSSLSFINSFKRDIGYVYSAALKNGYLYMATNQGLFYAPENNVFSDIRPMPGVEGQSWDLSLYDGQLFCGNNEGTFEVTGQHIRLVSDIKGGTCMRKALIHGQEILIQSTYTYLVIYKKDTGNRWIFSHIVKDFMHPLRFIEVDVQGNIWAQHFYKGVYRIKLSPDLQTAEQTILISLPELEKEKKSPRLLKIRGRIILTNTDSFFIYDDITDSIKSYNSLNTELSTSKGINKSIFVNDNLYWLVGSGKFILADFSEKNIRIKQEISFSSLYNELPDNDENIVVLKNKFLFCLSNGIAILDNEKQTFKSNWNKKLYIGRIESINNDENIRLLSLNPKQIPEIEYLYNTLVFHASFPYFQGENVKYSFKLDGVDKEWSIPSLQSVKEYARLHPGDYVLHIKAIDNLGNELDSTRYVFEIKTPFYAGKIAMSSYCMLALFIILLVYWAIRRHIVKNKQKVLEEQQTIRRKETEQQEHKIIQLKNEKLEAELTHKSKELAGSTMSIIRKNEILVSIKEELTLQKEKMGNQYPNKYFEKLIRMIDSSLSSEDDWQIFQSNFDRIHENFFRHLKANYPDLTPTDLRLCAFLRLNLNTKEIANLMNITIKGVEVGRYRLRKKLKLASEINLVDFMINFK